MNKKDFYRAPSTIVVMMSDEPLMSLSAKTGKHVYDEGLDTEDGWTDDDYF